ncbi:hypothetical protein CERZMDRAFT_52618, partial [Cercospora zeae-maydis SCOH1-5]
NFKVAKFVVALDSIRSKTFISSNIREAFKRTSICPIDREVPYRFIYNYYSASAKGSV